MLDINPSRKYNLSTKKRERPHIMKKTLKILLPILLAIVIVICSCWYLFVYDREFTRDVLVGFARVSESNGSHSVAAWFYQLAYAQAGNNDAVACELAQQYKSTGNYTKAEYTLSNAIADGGGIELYIALCKTYVEQDKLLDAVNMLNNITNPEIKQQLDAIRPSAPTAVPAPGFYSQYISVTLEAPEGTIFADADGQYPSTQTTPYTEPIALKDGENTIQAIAVAENGLVSPLSIYAYTIGGVIEAVEFNDSLVETSIRKILNVDADKTLYTNDLWTIKEFTVPSGAKSLADLKHMTFLEKLTIDNAPGKQLENISSMANLTELSIANTPVSQDELNVIAALPLLKKLTLQKCSLTGIAPLKNATGLVSLDLSNNTIRVISAISAMKELQELNLSHNAVADLTPLSSSTALTSLNVSSNDLKSLAALSTLTGLKTLDAGTNAITDLGEIGNLTALTVLSLKSNKLSKIGALNKCTALTDLNIASNALKDISGLSKLTGLMYFDCSYNKLTSLPSFPKNCALVSINAAHNTIKNVDPLSGLKHLNKVNMDYNPKLSSIKSLAKCPVLVEVNVYGTKVTSVSALTDIKIIVNYDPT
ncbi:MAG: leucine-rich repeat domain-containing protein [Oscillospiraceae bacterium]|nr:leucine-rich repeat domain-containing protein [Oscillospiraceae bacterium]